MKKFLLITAGILAALSASAQLKLTPDNIDEIIKDFLWELRSLRHGPLIWLPR